MSQNKTNHPAEEEHGHAHATDKFYYTIAVILAIITFAEVAYPYATHGTTALAPLFRPLLGIMSLVKFGLVVAYFMHLKYDPKILTHILIFAMCVAVMIIVALILLMLI